MADRELRALRGATTAPSDDSDAIVGATEKLLGEMIARNGIEVVDLVSVIFTSTKDLTAEFPAAAARRLGISSVPLLCAQEIEVPGSVPRCIRVLMHFYTNRSSEELRHVYRDGAEQLRTDLAE